MAPKKGKGSKKDDFEDNSEVAEKPSKAPTSKNKSKGKNRDDSPEGKKLSKIENIDSDDGGQGTSKRENKKSKNKEDADKVKNPKVGQSTSTSKSVPKKKQKGKGKNQEWNSDEEPEIDLLNRPNKDSDSEDDNVLPVKNKKITMSKKKFLDESEDSGADGLSNSDSDVEDLTSKVSNVDISDAKSHNKLDDTKKAAQIQPDTVSQDVILPQENLSESNCKSKETENQQDKDSKEDQAVEVDCITTESGGNLS